MLDKSELTKALDTCFKSSKLDVNFGEASKLAEILFENANCHCSGDSPTQVFNGMILNQISANNSFYYALFSNFMTSRPCSLVFWERFDGNEGEIVSTNSRLARLSSLKVGFNSRVPTGAHNPRPPKIAIIRL